MTARIGVVLFPGSNCEHDAVEAVEKLGGQAEILWHGDRSASGVDAIILPGGFAHGDYLRPGAIARFSPIMTAVEAFARDGGPVVGICNGFQVLTEAHLLPGALQKNRGLTFLCQTVEIEVASDQSVLTSGISPGTRLRVPINHFEGNYTCDQRTLDELVGEGRVVLRYVDNPNGSVGDIAGISNPAGNVVGLMPHPERAVDPLLGSEDGAVLLRALLSVAEAVVVPADAGTTTANS
ncbi:MAG: phosphoribosylformylglycinamidine synthase subunit PurQ [Acidimicrobiales bacterium]|nr:phosphoribosylformylglycinamidine synthase subunit PurQ [Acidimicrobiales bacterium]